MKKWRCGVCGYIHTWDEPPDVCPNCGSPKDVFADFTDNPDILHMHHTEKVSSGENVEVNPFYGNYESLAPYIYNLPVGRKVGLHKHPTTDELFFIIKGKLRFRVGDQQFDVGPGDVVQGKMDIPHSFENIGKEPAAFLSVKGPKPVDLVKIE